MSSSPEISVVIPAYNAAATLRESLESVFASEGVSFEVVLVNDASTDDTRQIAIDAGCRVLSMRRNILSANCRNEGAEIARGEILVFFDADQLMLPDTLRRYRDTLLAHPDVDAVVGSFVPDTPVPGFFSRFKNFQHHYTHQTANPEGATLASGQMAIRRDLFRAVGGFEPAFSGASIEDIALGYRMVRAGYRIRFERTIRMVHLKGYTLAQMVRSDILHRAIPWTGLMLRERIFRSDLNTSGGNVLSVVSAWLLPIALVAGLMWRPAWAAVVILPLVIAFLNRGMLLAARREFGWWFALRAAAFLPVMYFYHGLGLLLGVAAYATGRSVAARRDPPVAEFELHEPAAK